ncbi:hypothetical protein [Shinella zoogloeoides]
MSDLPPLPTGFQLDTKPDLPPLPEGFVLGSVQPRTENEVRAEFDNMPWYQKAAVAADDVARSIANGATFGYADKLAGWVSGTGTEAERQKSDEASMRGGSATTTAEIGGAIATPVLAASAGLSLPRIAGSVSGVTGAAARSGLAAIEGAGYGALNATGHDQDIGQGALMGAIFGGAGNAAGEAVAGGARKLAGVFNRRPQIPTLDELSTAARQAYDAADNAGVIFTPQATGRLQSEIVQTLTDLGFDPALQPGAAAVLRRLQDLQGQNVTLKGLDTLRKVASGGFIPGNKSNNSAISAIVNRIDELVGNTQAGEVLSGDATAGAEALKTARDLWSRMSKADSVTEAAARGELNAAAAGSGANRENASRQAMKALQNRSATRGFTPDEHEALMRAIVGTPDQNALRLLGKLAPTGIVSGALSSGAGYQMGGPIGAVAIPAVGYAARKGAERMQDGFVQDLVDIIMAGGNRAATQASPNALQAAIDANRNTFVKSAAAAAQYEGSR